MTKQPLASRVEVQEARLNQVDAWIKKVEFLLVPIPQTLNEALRPEDLELTIEEKLSRLDEYPPYGNWKILTARDLRQLESRITRISLDLESRINTMRRDLAELKFAKKQVKGETFWPIASYMTVVAVASFAVALALAFALAGGK